MLPNITQVLTFFNLLSGIMLTLSLTTFVGGFIMYLVRLGTWPTYRETAVYIMRIGVSILFVLVVILGIQQFLLQHLLVGAVVGALIIIYIIFWAFQDVFTEEKPPERREVRR